MADYARDHAGRDAVKWVQQDNFHLTYAFLGELDPKAAEAAGEGLRASVDGIKAFDIVLGNFGVFPSPRRPSVLWVGMTEGARELKELAGRISAGLAKAGFMFENRFEPHVTIGRVKGQLPDSFMRRMSGYAPSRRFRNRIASVELTESRLSQEGPSYSTLCSVKLL